MLLIYALRGKCPYLKFFWSVFSHVPYSVQMRENTDQKNSEYGYFSRTDAFNECFSIFQKGTRNHGKSGAMPVCKCCLMHYLNIE